MVNFYLIWRLCTVSVLSVQFCAVHLPKLVLLSVLDDTLSREVLEMIQNETCDEVRFDIIYISEYTQR